jgi:hypothetical protein
MKAPAPAPGVPGLPAPDREVRPEDLDVHLIVDNYCAHKHLKVRAWLAQRPRFHMH